MEDENIVLHIPLNDESLRDEGDIEMDGVLKYDPNLKEPAPYEPNNNLQSNYAIISEKIQKQLTNLNEIEGTDTHNDTTEQTTSISDKKTDETMTTTYEENDSCLIFKTLNGTKYQFSAPGIEEIDKDNNVHAIKKTKVHEIMHDFVTSKENNEWPSATSICCFWCCHRFNESPVGIPQRYNRSKFYLTGCFCSFNCAASYIFNEKEQNMWEKYALLNLLYTVINGSQSVKIKLAPPRQCLQMFGGTMDVETFRSSSLKNNSNYKVINPPLVSIIPQMEETHMENIHRKKAQSLHQEFSAMYTSNADTQLKLKREKPLINKSNTLENYMSLKIL